MPPVPGKKALDFVAWRGRFGSFSVSGTCQKYSATLTSFDARPSEFFLISVFALNFFFSFSWIETDMKALPPLDRKNGQSSEISHSQLYTCPGSMTGYPEGAEAET